MKGAYLVLRALLYTIHGTATSFEGREQKLSSQKRTHSQHMHQPSTWLMPWTDTRSTRTLLFTHSSVRLYQLPDSFLASTWPLRGTCTRRTAVHHSSLADLTRRACQQLMYSRPRAGSKRHHEKQRNKDRPSSLVVVSWWGASAPGPK